MPTADGHSDAPAAHPRAPGPGEVLDPQHPALKVSVERVLSIVTEKPEEEAEAVASKRKSILAKALASACLCRLLVLVP